jgi:hypothetical protein
MTTDSKIGKPHNPFNPPRPPMRVFEVRYSVPSQNPNHTVPDVVRTFDAAYWDTDGDARSITSEGHGTYDFISFKDSDGKRVFSVRRDLVQYIEMVGEPQDDRPAFQDIIDADPWKTETGTAWDEGKILRGVLRGRLAIDSARVLLGYEPFHLPETLHPFTYTRCPNGCDGVKTGCSDCPPRK